MSIKLPPPDSPLREFFDTAHLAEICHPNKRDQLPTVRQAIASARDFLIQEPAAKSVQTICLKSDRTIELVQITMASHKTLHVFGRL